jgi:CubicO group peptidase (beta-lactamase class C family)
MTSGFDWDEWSYPYGDPNNTLTQMYDSGNNVQFVLDIPMRSNPGEEWVYCSGASHLLSAIIGQTSGMSTYSFAKQYLFDPIGIFDAYWLVDSQGVHLGGGGLSLSPSDMARFGYLYLNEGRWEGEQIVPREWVLQSLEVIVDLGGYDGYSYQWWNVPTLGVTHASGLYGQRICVIPAYNMVVVFTADTEDQMIEIDILTNYIIPAVLTESPSLERFAGIPVLALMLAPLFISYAIYQGEMKKFLGGTFHD